MGIQKLFTSFKPIDGNVFVGDEGRLWFNDATSTLYYSDGVTPGGIPITSGTGGGGSANIIVQDESSTLTSAVSTLNFVGNGVTASAIGDIVTINIANIGPMGPQGPQGNTGPAGDTITSANVVNGNLQLTLSSGNTITVVGSVVGPQGPQGNVGATGPQGNVGPQGPQGAPGADGADGADGTSISSATVIGGNLQIVYSNAAVSWAGTVQGATGANGAAGANGVSISNAVVSSGNLIITFSNAAVINAGYVVGPQGPQGNVGATGPQGNVGPAGAGANLNVLTNSGTLTSVANLNILGGNNVTTRITNGNVYIDAASSSIATTFETLSKNLNSYPYVINRSGTQIANLVYTLPSTDTITKTLNYSAGKISNISIAGTALSNVYVKTLNYSGDNIVGATYSVS